MRQSIITVDNLLRYMGKENYSKFIKEFRNRNKIQPDEAIWIIGEWSE